MSTEFHELEIANVVRETPDCASFELSVPSHLVGEYRYQSGQHLTFRFPWDGFEVTRCYSLSSCPDLDETMKLAVTRVEGGRISNWINDEWKPGDTVSASVPEGRFVLDPATRNSTPLFLFAGGSGITPILSVRTLTIATGFGAAALLASLGSSRTRRDRHGVDPRRCDAHPRSGGDLRGR